MDYLDFDMLIEHSGAGYKARVLNSPMGQASIDFQLPFSQLELENFLLKIGRPRRGLRRIDSPEMETAKSFGGHLFETIFNKEVRGCLHSSLDLAKSKGSGLRLRLRLTSAPELTELPWEYLYNPTLNRFLSLSLETPIVRYLDIPERIQPLQVIPPVKVLAMISSPYNYPPLNVEEEWNKLHEALGDLERRGMVSLERLKKATLSALQKQLRQDEYHIFHFIGHGGFDQQTQDGVLILEDEQERGRQISGQYLGALLHDETTLRLAILNACEGARGSSVDPFAGTAQSLVQQGVPAVIAMQFEVTDQAAITFAHEFYDALADGFPVDAALTEARKTIFAQGNDIEWGTPVLYMRSPDGRIFDITKEDVNVIKENRSQVAPQSPRPKLSKPFVFALVMGCILLAGILGIFFLPKSMLQRFIKEGAIATTNLSISSQPEDAAVFVNGDSIGNTPIKDFKIKAGLTSLRIHKQNYLPIDSTLVAREGQPASFTFSLKPAAIFAIQVNPTGAVIILDGKTIDATRLSNLTVAAGRHNIIISRAEYFPIEDSFELVAGKNPVRQYTLTQKSAGMVSVGGVSIKSNVSEASVLINKKFVGTTPYENHDLEPGQHRILVRHEGYEDFSTTLTVRSGQTRSIMANLNKITPADANPTPQMGTLQVLVNPFGSIYIDGKLRQSNSDLLYKESLPAGSHLLTVTHPQHGKWEKEIAIEAKKSRDLTIDFNRRATLTVTSTPTWGEIYVDGQSTGQQSPQQLTLRIGQHKIEVRRTGYSTVGGAKLMHLEEDAKIEFTLEKSQ